MARRTALSQGSTLSALFDSVGEWRERMRQRRQLMKLDDRLLADIGLSRADAEAECGKMWRR